MSEPRYRVTFAGEVAAGHTAADVQQSMASTFKLPEAQVAQLFSGRRAVLKKDLDADGAERMRQALANIGAVVSVEPMEPAPSGLSLEPTEPPPAPAAPEPPAPPPVQAPESPPPATAPSSRQAPDLGGPAAGPAPKPEPAPEAPVDLYAPPSASLEREEELEDSDAHAPERVAFGRGWGWIADGARIFGRSIGLWIATAVLAFIIFVVVSLIPIINIFLPSMLFPLFGAGFMIAAHRLAHGGEMEIGDLFAGFKRRPGALMGVGLVYLVGSLIVFGAVFAVALGGGAYVSMMTGDPQAMESLVMSPVFWISMLVAMGLMLPLIALTWFSPALIAVHDVPFGRALMWSMSGCFKNFLPFLLYGIIMGVFLFAAAIPLMLGWLVAVPILITSIYAGYRDIYLN